MNIGIVSFSETGGRLGKRLLQELTDLGCRTEGFLFCRYQEEGLESFDDLHELTCCLFDKEDIILFISAVGIAVRAIAPFLKNKIEDPGVLAMDECGSFVVSVLSGHTGGANYYAGLVAGIVDACPVITTATDRSGRFAVDTWASRNHLRVLEADKIKEISSRILSGEKVGFFSDIPVEGRLPEGVVRDSAEAGILVSYDRKLQPFPITCRLLPMDYVLGIGCRKGKNRSELEAFVRTVFQKHRLDVERVGKICSIDIKRDEEGLKGLSRALRVPFETFSVRQLQEAEGLFTSSDFVERHAGVDNVCERSACMGSGQGEKVLEKQAFDGMTLSVYRRKVGLSFPFPPIHVRKEGEVQR